MLVIYTITIFLSASLVFLIQPMVAKMVLPLLGGTPAVWNTAMMFFQFMLLLGYLYAHLGTRWLGVRRHAWLHVGLMLPPVLLLPVMIREEWVPPAVANPVWWLVLVLVAAVGLPFLVVSASAPLLQRWFSATGHKAASDPYFLYAASNAGSMIALLSYPLLVEVLLPLPEQSEVWSIGYVALIVLMAVCVMGMGGPRRAERSQRAKPDSATPQAAAVEPFALRAIAPGRLVRWALLAFAPSSLMLGVTTYITTDLVVVPLLWVIPLALYLLSFILVFARRQFISPTLMRRLMPVAVVVLLMMIVSEATEPMLLIAPVHLATFFILAMVCHGELARDRPPAAQLTTFYLMMSIGGLLGGVFNALVAPVVFTSIAEYPVAIVAACFLAPALLARNGATREPISAMRDIAPAVAVGVGTASVLALAVALPITFGPLRLGLTAAAPALACFVLSRRTGRFALAVGAVFLVSSFDATYRGDVLESERTFFGVHRVTRVRSAATDEASGRAFNMLYHGTTLHGQQHIDPDTGLPTDPEVPLAYYHHASPIGQLLPTMQTIGRAEYVGLIGLGVGALAAYAQEGHQYTYFEIDPTVQRIAEEKRYFTYLAAARQRGASIETVLGDARLTLARNDAMQFDVLVADAFSSDAIPVHLLTREAIELYISRLRDGGVLALHISNRYLNLEPVVANIAAELELVCLVQHDMFLDAAEIDRTGRQNSSWIVIARRHGDLAPLLTSPAGPRWSPATVDPSARLWTDQYSNIVRALLW